MNLFNSLTPIKDKKHLGTSGITKLAAKPYLQGLASKIELNQLFQQFVNQTKCSEMSDPGQQLDFREFCFFITTYLLSFLKRKNRVDSALSVAQLIESLAE